MPVEARLHAASTVASVQTPPVASVSSCSNREVRLFLPSRAEQEEPTRVVGSGSSSVLPFPPLSPTTQRPGPSGHLPWKGHQTVLRQENVLKLLFSRTETRARDKVEQQRQPRGSVDRGRASKALCAESAALCWSRAPVPWLFLLHTATSALG